MEISQDEIKFLYQKIKGKSFKEYNKGNYQKTLTDISVAATIAYKSCFIYKDDDLETLLSDISLALLPPQTKKNDYSKRYVFLDSFGTPNKGLTQQYLRGLISLNVEFLYVSLNVLESREPVYNEVRNSAKGELFLVKKVSKLDQIQLVYDQILRFEPTAIFSHISPWDVVATTVLYAFPHSIKYNINLTDHAFWLGAGCFNYNFEFRNYGCTVSLEKRGFSKSQLLLNPYYPIVDLSIFQGLPDSIKGKVVLFSGGSYYKIYGEDFIFPKMMRKILEDNPDAVLLFAGNGDEAPLKRFLCQNNLESRFLLLGHRKDINEVFAHSDIYLGTYPLAGGLMTQYAAYNSKPIVAYANKSTTNRIEDLIITNNDANIQLTYTNLDDYYAEVEHLIKDSSYRQQRGQVLKDALTSKKSFDSQLEECVMHKKGKPFSILPIDYDERVNWYLSLLNISIWELGFLLIRHYKLKSLFYSPKIVIGALPRLFSKLF